MGKIKNYNGISSILMDYMLEAMMYVQMGGRRRVGVHRLQGQMTSDLSSILQIILLVAVGQPPRILACGGIGSEHVQDGMCALFPKHLVGYCWKHEPGIFLCPWRPLPTFTVL